MLYLGHVWLPDLQPHNGTVSPRMITFDLCKWGIWIVWYDLDRGQSRYVLALDPKIDWYLSTKRSCYLYLGNRYLYVGLVFVTFTTKFRILRYYVILRHCGLWCSYSFSARNNSPYFKIRKKVMSLFYYSRKYFWSYPYNLEIFDLININTKIYIYFQQPAKINISYLPVSGNLLSTSYLNNLPLDIERLFFHPRSGSNCPQSLVVANFNSVICKYPLDQNLTSNIVP